MAESHKTWNGMQEVEVTFKLKRGWFNSGSRTRLEIRFGGVEVGDGRHLTHRLEETMLAFPGFHSLVIRHRSGLLGGWRTASFELEIPRAERCLVMLEFGPGARFLFLPKVTVLE
jgi:hypothetical protein